jgi:hypothetical protein
MLFHRECDAAPLSTPEAHVTACARFDGGENQDKTKSRPSYESILEGALFCLPLDQKNITITSDDVI